VTIEALIESKIPSTEYKQAIRGFPNPMCKKRFATRATAEQWVKTVCKKLQLKSSYRAKRKGDSISDPLDLEANDNDNSENQEFVEQGHQVSPYPNLAADY
jgi:hypothetical protein